MSKHYPEDVKQKALTLLRSCGGGSAGNTVNLSIFYRNTITTIFQGSYSQSTGVDIIRKHAAQFVERRDGFPCDPESVCLSGGASESIRVL